MKYLRKFIYYLKDKSLILIFAVSNLLVLTLIFKIFFETNIHQYKLLSLLEDSSESLKLEIQEKCQNFFEKILEGTQESFNCAVKSEQKNYQLRISFMVAKKDNQIEIKDISGNLVNTFEQVTEVDFCDECFEDRVIEMASLTIEPFMKEIFDLAESMYQEAKEANQEAHEEFKNMDSKKLATQMKVRNCEGTWNQKTESFVRFENTLEELNCLLERMDKKGDSLSVEFFFHKKVKKELWRLYADSKNIEEALLKDEWQRSLEKILESFDDPYRYSLSIRSSVSLLQNFMIWKEDFDVLESNREKETFVLSISEDIKNIANILQNAEQDMHYINEGFEGIYKSLNQSSQIEQVEIIPPNVINYEDVEEIL